MDALVPALFRSSVISPELTGSPELDIDGAFFSYAFNYSDKRFLGSDFSPLPKEKWRIKCKTTLKNPALKTK